MKKNVGAIDRIVRIIVAVVFAVLFFTGTVSGALGIILLVLACIFVLTAITSFCPLYIPFKINTGKEK